MTKIGRCAFFGCENLTSVHIPEGVTYIGACAFCECDNLTSVNIPDSVTEIENNTFEDSDNLKIICNKGSYAEKYAEIHQIPVKIERTNNFIVNEKWVKENYHGESDS